MGMPQAIAEALKGKCWTVRNFVCWIVVVGEYLVQDKIIIIYFFGTYYVPNAVPRNLTF